MAQDVSDDVCDSWEEMIENGVLEKKLEELQMKVPKNNSSSDDAGESECNRIPQLRLEDSSRTSYVPQVKILKRPNDAKSGVVGGTVEKSPSRQPMKSLQQREAEYAEARLRILGSASSEEEGQKASSVPQVSLATAVRNNRSGINIIREPLGPDGTKGFLQHRHCAHSCETVVDPCVGVVMSPLLAEQEKIH